MPAGLGRGTATRGCYSSGPARRAPAAEPRGKEEGGGGQSSPAPVPGGGGGGAGGRRAVGAPSPAGKAGAWRGASRRVGGNTGRSGENSPRRASKDVGIMRLTKREV